MNTKHTPGNWRRFGGMVDGYGIISDNLEIVIEQGYNGLHNEANAKLIAAAPKLLELCLLVVRTYEDDGFENMNTRDEVIYNSCKNAIEEIIE